MTALVVNTGLVVPVTASAQPAPTSVTFQYTGNVQTWTVPAGVVEATFDLYGAEGGAVPNHAPGGLGGHTQATMPLTAGSTINILVGGVGGAAGGCGSDNFDLQPGGGGGFNGGANGMEAQCPGGGGGGGTDVRIGGLDVSNRVLVAGGGGGAAIDDGGCAATGGPGGGQTGGKGQCGHGGSGGNQDGGSGSGQFGFGSTGSGTGPGCQIYGGGGGGGGYWGGGGGSMEICDQAAGGGGGGSASGPPGTLFQSGANGGNGRIVISYNTVPPPTITSISPANGPIYGTTTVTITGTNLNSDPAGPIVHFGGRQARGVCSSATQCTAISPKGTGTVDVVAEVALVKSGPRPFNYVAAPIPMPTFKQLLDRKVDVADIGAQVVASGADRAALTGADLHGVNLSGVSFIGEPVDLVGTHLDGATLTGSNFALADFSGATLTNISAAGASFEGADFAAQGTAHPAANLSGANTNLQTADFVNADVSGAKFVGADLTGAVFTGARGVDTDFAGVRARNAVFADAHLYGNGQAFHAATDLENVDFTGAVMAGDVDESGGFDFTGSPLTGARFDGAVCVACNFTNATLNQATFTGAYLPGVALSGAHLSGVSFDRAWLYCGSLANDHCAKVPGSEPRWAWPLTLGSGESFGPVPFASTNLTGVDLSVVSTCPDGKPGVIAPAGCSQANLLPRPAEQPLLPAPCSASAHGGCPTATSTLFQSSSFGDPVAVVAAVPPTWNTALSTEDYYVAFDDSTVRRVGAEASVVVAGRVGGLCEDSQSACGDGGPATAALLSEPSGLAVGLDGSLYIADAPLRRVRKVDPSGTITTVAGTGAQCGDPFCGDGGPATSAQLTTPLGVAVDPYGVLLIADGTGGLRRVAVDGTISSLTPRFQDVWQAVVTGADGTIYAAAQVSDRIAKIDPTTGAITTVVGTGTSGYNGNTDQSGFLLPGAEVQINQPSALSVDLDGNVIFADTTNHLIRAYVPSTGNVIDDLAGSIVNGAPIGGFNGDGHFSNETQLHAPLGVTATRGPLLVIADTDNQRVRQVGPAPLETTQAPPPGEVVISCSTQGAWSCERVPKPLDVGAAASLGAVSISHEGTEFAVGRWLAPVGGRVRFLVIESRPLVPGSYELAFGLAGRGFRRTIQLTQGL